MTTKKKIQELAAKLPAQDFPVEGVLSQDFLKRKKVEEDLAKAGLDWGTNDWRVEGPGAITGYAARNIATLEEALDVAEQHGFNVRPVRKRYGIARLTGKSRVPTWQEKKAAMLARFRERRAE